MAKKKNLTAAQLKHRPLKIYGHRGRPDVIVTFAQYETLGRHFATVFRELARVKVQLVKRPS